MQHHGEMFFSIAGGKGDGGEEGLGGGGGLTAGKISKHIAHYVIAADTRFRVGGLHSDLYPYVLLASF
eukprot:554327-Pelagomonas_calceolata.AAC.1